MLYTVGIRCIQPPDVFPLTPIVNKSYNFECCFNNMLQIVQNMMVSLGLEPEQSMFRIDYYIHSAPVIVRHGLENFKSIPPPFPLRYYCSRGWIILQCLAEVSAPVLFLPLNSIVNMSCKICCWGACSCTFHPSKMPFYHSRVKLTSFSNGVSIYKPSIILDRG